MMGIYEYILIWILWTFYLRWGCSIRCSQHFSVSWKHNVSWWSFGCRNSLSHWQSQLLICLQERVWSDRDLTNATKLSIYNTCVLKALLYACETWTPLRRHFEVLETFHHQSLRRILKIKWQAFIPDTEVLGLAKFGSIESIIMQERLWDYAGLAT